MAEGRGRSFSLWAASLYYYAVLSTSPSHLKVIYRVPYKGRAFKPHSDIHSSSTLFLSPLEIIPMLDDDLLTCDGFPLMSLMGLS